ncbi:MAG: hypothetical protein FWG44_04540, partial [Oscillospiraceae bacterium]|nr:hypothetical protein [Oscillospiraceae bacterium]
MKIALKNNQLLLKVLSMKNPPDNDCLLYAQNVEAEIITPETLRLISRYNVEKYELILIDAKPLSAFKTDEKSLILLKAVLKGKRIYFSRLYMDGDSFAFSSPEQITFEIENPENSKLQRINKRLHKKQKITSFSKAHKQKIEGYLEQINREVITGLINAVKRDLDFILHFNAEMFHHNLSAKGLSFTKDTVAGIYEDERYTKIIDLSDSRERMGFISLYAIAFFGLSLNDLYSVDGIFTFTIDIDNNVNNTKPADTARREADDKKRRAGQAVFELIFNENREETEKCVLVMAKTLMKLPLPEINISVNSFIKKNYGLYCGLGDIGRAFSRVIIGSTDKIFDEAVKTARRISYYSLLERLFDEMLLSNQGNEKSTETELYKRASDFSKVAAGKKTAGELTFSVEKAY